MNTSVATPMDAKRVYIDAAHGIASREPWLRELRASALAQFDALGFPTPQYEAWKYTNISGFARQTFNPMAAPSTVDRSALAAAAIAGDTPRLVFVDGRFAPELSVPPSWTGPLSLAQALTAEPAAREYLGKIAPLSTHAFAALNTAFLTDGLYLRIPSGVVMESPLHVMYIGTPGALAQPHALIVAEAGSRATIIEHYVASGAERYVTNGVTEIVLERGATLEHYRIQQEGTQAYHVGGIYVRQARESLFAAYALDLGSQLSRSDLNVSVAENAVCNLNGLYVADGRQHIDNHTLIDHIAPRGTSRELYKGVLAGRARAVFNGRVVVQKDAQQIDAQQMNNNLLLSDDVEIDTKPEFEIYADDVKCGHGATVGQLDIDALFYLRSRALSETAARDLLTYAFVDEIVGRFQISALRRSLEQTLRARLLQGRELKELDTI